MSNRPAKNDLLTAIRESLRRPCEADILGPHLRHADWIRSRSLSGDEPASCRIAVLRRLLTTFECPNPFRLALLMGVSVSTIQRDLAFLRDHHGLRTEWDARRNGFRVAFEALLAAPKGDQP